MKIISKKFRAELMSRIDTAFSRARAEAVKTLVEAYLSNCGVSQASVDADTWALFLFIRPEIDKAVMRSERCRQAARRRRQLKQEAAEAETAAPAAEAAPEYDPVANALFLEATNPVELFDLPPHLYDQLPRPVRRRLQRRVLKDIHASAG